MTTIPTGAPAWLRTNDFTAYGGDLNKKNFASRGVVNPKTDVGAEAFARMTADLAAVARTAPFAVIKLLCNDGTPAAPAIEYCALMTGVRTVSYAGDAAPVGFPSAERNGDGDITITFDASYTDPYGVIGAFSLAHAQAQLLGSTPGAAIPEPVSATQVRVRAYTLAGAALADVEVVVTIGAGA